MQQHKPLASTRTGYSSSASLYGGDIALTDADRELESYWKKGAKKKGKGGQQQQGQQPAQGKKKHASSSTPTGFTNLGYGLIDESTSLVFTQKLVKGESQVLEKDYLRLTSQADPSKVRSPAVLAQALTMVKRKWMDTQDYAYCCNQLKSIRQDCTVQHLRDKLTVEVYETHARIALESGDLQEFGVVQTQLQLLYKDGLTNGLERESEFAAYKILYSCLMTGPSDAGLVAFINGLRAELSANPAVQHALSVRSSLLTTNFALFFSLWSSAPNMSAYLMDPLADSMRVRSTRILICAYRPTLSMAHMTRALAFDKEDADDASGSAAAAASSSAAAAASPAVPARPAPTQAQMRACKAYLDSTFEGLIVYTREPPKDGQDGPPRLLIDCKASHDRLAPTNAAHRLPINSSRAKHTVSASSPSLGGAGPVPIAAAHDVAMWCKKDLTGKIKLGALDSSHSMRPLSSSSSTGQPGPRMPYTSLSSSSSPLPSPSPSPPPSSADAASRKRKQSQPLASMTYEELREGVEELEATLLQPNVKKQFDDFNLQLMMSRLKAMQKAMKKAKKTK